MRRWMLIGALMTSPVTAAAADVPHPNASSMRNTGIALNVGGTAMLVGGTYVYARGISRRVNCALEQDDWFEQCEPRLGDVFGGLLAMTFAIPMLGGGTTLWAMGQYRMNKNRRHLSAWIEPQVDGGATLRVIARF